MSRPKGVPNKPKRALLRLIQEKYPGYNPAMELVKVAMDTEADENMRFSANKELLQYLEPKLKAVEVVAEVDGTITLSWGKAK